MPSRGAHDRRTFDIYAKVDNSGHVVAMVEVAAGLQPWTDGEGNRYVWLTDLAPLDVYGVQLLPVREV